MAGNQGVDNGCPVDLQTNGVLGQLDPLKNHPQKVLFVGWAANLIVLTNSIDLREGRFEELSACRLLNPIGELDLVGQKAMQLVFNQCLNLLCRDPPAVLARLAGTDEAVRHVIAVPLAILGGIGRT